MTIPQPETESVWDYPRPPRVERDPRLVVVRIGDVVLAETTSALRVLETSHPPGYYIPPDDVSMEHLICNDHSSVCEFKGRASYFDLQVDGESVPNVAWTYPSPSEGFENIENHVAFYPGKVQCFVAGERVLPQEGTFYGGWITADIRGPFKGAPGTSGW